MAARALPQSCFVTAFMACAKTSLSRVVMGMIGGNGAGVVTVTFGKGVAEGAVGIGAFFGAGLGVALAGFGAAFLGAVLWVSAAFAEMSTMPIAAPASRSRA